MNESRRTPWVFVATCVLMFYTLGAGLLESYVVYPSWYPLAGSDVFALHHASISRSILPFLVAPLLIGFVLSLALLWKRPSVIPLWAMLGSVGLQLVVLISTVTLFIPIQTALGQAGQTALEVNGLIDRLRQMGWVRDVPGVINAGLYVWMLSSVVSGTNLEAGVVRRIEHL
jgi:hypothetical protein